MFCQPRRMLANSVSPETHAASAVSRSSGLKGSARAASKSKRTLWAFGQSVRRSQEGAAWSQARRGGGAVKACKLARQGRAHIRLVRIAERSVVDPLLPRAQGHVDQAGAAPETHCPPS